MAANVERESLADRHLVRNTIIIILSIVLVIINNQVRRHERFSWRVDQHSCSHGVMPTKEEVVWTMAIQNHYSLLTKERQDSRLIGEVVPPVASLICKVVSPGCYPFDLEC